MPWKDQLPILLQRIITLGEGVPRLLSGTARKAVYTGLIPVGTFSPEQILALEAAHRPVIDVAPVPLIPRLEPAVFVRYWRTTDALGTRSAQYRVY